MANTALPSLSSAGWIVDPNTKADRMMAHFLAANKSQNGTFAANATISFQQLCQAFGHDIPLLCRNTSDALTDYFNRYYDSCDVDVSATYNGTNSAGPATIHLKLVYRVGSVGYDLATNLMLINGKFDAVLTAANSGATT